MYEKFKIFHLLLIIRNFLSTCRVTLKSKFSKLATFPRQQTLHLTFHRQTFLSLLKVTRLHIRNVIGRFDLTQSHLPSHVLYYTKCINAIFELVIKFETVSNFCKYPFQCCGYMGRIILIFYEWIRKEIRSNDVKLAFAGYNLSLYEYTFYNWVRSHEVWVKSSWIECRHNNSSKLSHDPYTQRQALSRHIIYVCIMRIYIQS